MVDVSPALQIESVYDAFSAALRRGESPRIELSFCYERLAEFAVREGNLDAAAEHYEREVNVPLQAIEADPKNAKYRQEVQVPLGKLTAVDQQLQRGEAAVAAQKRVHDALAHQAP